ncbi:MAG: spore coat protein [Oscillospiraceae bacterium]|jgi:spore coat protein CotF|nr:spore coat protein [Oscillospiraceae bacterium]
MPQQKFQDQEILTDMLASQKQATSSYNLFSNECSDQNLKNDMLNILRDEQSMQSAVFGEMSKRGWYQPPQAQQQMVEQARAKFEGISQQLS